MFRSRVPRVGFDLRLKRYRAQFNFPNRPVSDITMSVGTPKEPLSASEAPLSFASDARLASLFGEDTFFPTEVTRVDELGVSRVVVEDLICKLLLQVGSLAGQSIAGRIALPMALAEEFLHALRSRQLIVHQGQAQLNDYYYTLTDQGFERAQAAMRYSGYVGPVPVTLDDYILSIEAQTIRAEAPRRKQLTAAFADILMPPSLIEVLGPAINSGAGLFLYGPPGNGKTTIARRITRCFGQHVWIPRVISEDGQFIKLYDESCHTPVTENSASLLKADSFDRRWVKVQRPTVIVGGELTIDGLEIRHDPNTNVCEAPLQLKSNCGCLLIDDFGRQRIDPTELLNRWIVPLENRVDYLTLPTGKKIQVPFDQLIIFSTNLEPTDLADEAFLRRIPYKVEVVDPDADEYHALFKHACESIGCPYKADAVDNLIKHHYMPHNRPLRRCQPRDLLLQVRNYCTYNDLPFEMRKDHLDRVVRSYFTAIAGN